MAQYPGQNEGEIAFQKHFKNFQDEMTKWNMSETSVIQHISLIMLSEKSRVCKKVYLQGEPTDLTNSPWKQPQWYRLTGLTPPWS